MNTTESDLEDGSEPELDLDVDFVDASKVEHDVLAKVRSPHLP